MSTEIYGLYLSEILKINFESKGNIVQYLWKQNAQRIKKKLTWFEGLNELLDKTPKLKFYKY